MNWPFSYRTVIWMLLLLVEVPRLQFDGGGFICDARFVKRSTGSGSWVGEEEINYLTRFGYLADLGNAQMSGDQLSQAIRNLQGFAGIAQTGVVDSATKNLFIQRRCGVHDVSTGFRNKRHTSLQGEKWHRSNLSWSLLETDQMQYQRSYILRELHHALTVWGLDSTLDFQFLGNSEEADIRISFHRGHHGDGYPFDGIGVVLAHAFYPGGGRGGDAHFDMDERWSMSSVDVREEETSLYSVALHEFGHSLGLSHSSVHGSIMYPWYANSEPIYALPATDRQAIQALYGYSGKQDPNRRQDDDNRKRSSASYSSTTVKVMTSKEPLTTSTTPSPSGGQCGTNLDAVAVIRNEMWIFKGKYFWRRKAENLMQRTEPVEISSFWYGLPDHVTSVDAVYERDNHEIVFFSGSNYYVMFGNSHLLQGPLPLTKLGLPKTLDHIDGAMTWGYNKKTYFFSGSSYWAYDDNTRRVELDYARDISWWAGVPPNIDSVFQYTDKKTYFFKGSKFWEFDDTRKQVVNKTGKNIQDFWFVCPPSHLEISTSSSAFYIINNVKLNFLISLFYFMCFEDFINYI